MNIEAVLVSFSVGNGGQTYETSGILLDSERVLMTGTSLIPLLQREDWISSFVKSSSSRLESNEFLEKVSFRVLVEKTPEKLSSLESKATVVWKCPLVGESLKKLFWDWSLGHGNFGDESEALSSDDIELSKELMSIFLLVECKVRGGLEWTDERNKSRDDIRMLVNLISSSQKPSRGQEVEVVSTPFGNKHFMNSLSRGVVSNVVGREKCIILCDARTVSGCEGGPIFLSESSRKENEKHKLLGIVTCPLTWWRGEWVGFTIGISLMPVLRRLLRSEDCPGPVEEISQDASGSDQFVSGILGFADLLPLKFIDETVVLIRSSDSWGSGVVLNADSGIIVTCSHVVKTDKTVSVFHKGRRHSCDVVFRTQGDIPFDLAIVKAQNAFVIDEAKFSKNPPKVGETVIAAGFPFFSERDDISIRPSIATGCIARINPYMIQTTCCIQSGFSGGPLFRNGELIGIIISNARAGALYPHINFIVPSSTFKAPVLRYIKTKDTQSLTPLECWDAKVQALWKLQTSKL